MRGPLLSNAQTIGMGRGSGAMQAHLHVGLEESDKEEDAPIAARAGSNCSRNTEDNLVKNDNAHPARQFRLARVPMSQRATA